MTRYLISLVRLPLLHPGFFLISFPHNTVLLSCSMDDCYTFREELAITYPVHGHALWEPDPGGLYDTVAVGDVGFIREGCFYSLFNALRPPSESDPHHGPIYPPQLQPKRSPHIRSSTDNQRYFCSKNVTKMSWTPNIYASG